MSRIAAREIGNITNFAPDILAKIALDPNI
jgi:hypothetical protein